MKKYYLCIVLIAPLFVSAQKKVDLDRFNFKVQFRSLPNIKLDSTYRTYNVSVTGTKLMQPFLKDMEPSNTVLLQGWRKLPQDGHLNIEVKLQDLLPETVNVKERSIATKDRNGVVTGTKSVYYQEVVYTFEARAQITDYKGAYIMDEQLVSRSYKQTYTSPEFGLKALAEGYFILNSVNITKDLYRNCVNRSMQNLSSTITDNFGFAEVTAADYMLVIGSRKHPEYDDNRKAFQLMNQVLFNMNAGSSIIGAREKLQPAIEYFEQIKTTYSTSKKHDRKIRYASFFNLAVIYYYLDDPEQMMRQANGLILNDFNTGVGKSFQETALNLKNQFQQTNINTRHFSIDINEFKGPKEKPYIADNDY